MNIKKIFAIGDSGPIRHYSGMGQAQKVEIRGSVIDDEESLPSLS